jgi:hypothetical protein
MLLNLGMDLSQLKYPISSFALVFLICISLRVPTWFTIEIIIFLNRLVNVFVQLMGDVFPELKDNEKKIKCIIRDEEESFENTLAKVILVS